MNEVLYIRLNNHEQAPIAWLVWSNAEQEIIASGDLASAEQLTLLTDKAHQREVVAIVPSQDVALKSLNVPAKSQRAIRLAAPYMLEEELAQDVEQLFFAYGASKQHTLESNCLVAVVKKTLMTQWLTWLENANIHCTYMLPEVLALPTHQSNWSVTLMNDQLLVRQGGWQGIVLDKALWSEAIAQWQQLKSPPSIDSYTTLPADFDALQVNQQPQELPLALMAQQEKPIFNLLQGQFAIKSKRSPMLKHWVIAASVCTVALVLTLAQKGSALYQVKAQQQQIEQEIISTYQAAFPQTKKVRISTIKSQLKRHLGSISDTGNGHSFLSMMVKLQSAYAEVPGLKTTSIKFDDKRGEIRLTASANDYQAFDKFKMALEKLQLKVSQGAQNSQGDLVTGSISIKARS